MADPRYAQLTQALRVLESHLRQLGWWQASAPSAEALASSQPFALDTLSLPQWLQFIFIPRLTMLIATQQPLPAACGVAPMVEHYCATLADKPAELIACVDAIDQLLSQQP